MLYKYKPKKFLGQHFLIDKNISKKLITQIECINNNNTILEVGPGLGALTDLLYKQKYDLWTVEIDKNIVNFLHKKYPSNKNKILHYDILKFNIEYYFKFPITLIGNLPYNISSQILFWILKNKNLIDQVIIILQKEVGKKICAVPGTRNSNILSILLQSSYKIDYVYTITRNVFFPKPNVESSIIKFKRNKNKITFYDELLFFEIVKKAFGKRRKIISNALSSFNNINKIDKKLLQQRGENLTIKDYIYITNMLK